ncbi:hypothetical protein MHBO_000472 [Bonamia ostreae]|uniref:CSN8/PSMD8/EIF3K domain-containing protein n=1 Tax=Bonamia ostreae TaxID=126728 RepID=A0ABV2AFR7_9EUKA
MNETRTLSEASKLAEKIDRAEKEGKLDEVADATKSLKALLYKYSTPSENSINEKNISFFLLSRFALEVSALTDLLKKDFLGFENNVNILIPFYFDLNDNLENSDKKELILGLVLLHYLSENRTAAFYNLYEKMDRATSGSQNVRFALRIKKCLDRGSYSHILNCYCELPSPFYGYLMESLIKSTKAKIFEAMEKSKSEMTKESMIRIAGTELTAEDVKKLGEERKWKVDSEGTVHFEDENSSLTKEQLLNKASDNLMSLSYALVKDSERIV